MGVKRVNNKKNYHWEIWQWEIEYERVQRASCAHDHYVNSTTNVYDFICAYPEKRTAKEFLITDLMDHLMSIQREKNYSHNSCARIGHDIAAFWNWMRRYKDVNLPNMRCESFETRPYQVPALSENQFMKLCDACFNDEDREILREGLIGTPAKTLRRRHQWTAMALSYRWRRIRTRAGVPWIQYRLLQKSYRALILRLGAAALTKLIGEHVSDGLPLPTVPYKGRRTKAIAPQLPEESPLLEENPAASQPLG